MRKICNHVPERDASKFAGAGIVPYCISHDGVLHFMLAKEGQCGWKSSNKWSAFEGGRKAGERSADTAAREFVEESLGVIPMDGSVDKFSDAEAVAKALLGGKYTMRVVIHLKMKNETRVHVSYLKQCEWLPYLPEKFAMVRKTLSDAMNVASRLEYMQSKSVLPFRYPFLRENMVVVMHGSTFLVVSVDSVSVSGGSLFSTFRYVPDGEGSCESIRVAHVSCLVENSLHLQAYAEWFRYRKVATSFMQRAMQDIARHPAIACKYNINGDVISICVNRDYLEKSEIRMWSIGEVQEVLRNRGAAEAGQFRTCFLPALHVAVQKLQTVNEFSAPGTAQGSDSD